MIVLSLPTLVLLSLLRQAFSSGSAGHQFSPAQPSNFNQTPSPASLSFSFLVEEQLYQNLPNTNILGEISAFIKSSAQSEPSASCKALDPESLESPVFIFIDNQQSELFMKYLCEEPYIKAIVTVNSHLLPTSLDAHSNEIDYVSYVGSVCNQGSYNFIRGTCDEILWKRVLALTQDQQDLHDSYVQEKSNSLPGAIALYYSSASMYSDLFSEMVNDLYTYVVQAYYSSMQNYDWADAVSAVGSLLSSDFTTDSQADTLYSLAQYFTLPQTGSIENLLDIYNLYLLHYRKFDHSINNAFISRLEDVDQKIREKLNYYLTYSRGDSGSFSSHTEGQARLTYSYVSTAVDDPRSSICICGNCPSNIYKVKIVYEHISHFSDIAKEALGVGLNSYSCSEALTPLSVALYTESSAWNSYSSSGVFGGITVQGSIATYTPNSLGFFLLYPSVCLGSSVMDPNSHICCLNNCASCNTEGTCTTCNSGYSLTSDKTQCGCNGLSHCTVCEDSLDACRTCESSYKLQNDGSCLICGPNVGCTSCSADFAVCYQCDTGYYLNNQACSTCNSFSLGCTSCGYSYYYYSNSLYCNQCKSYYTLRDNKCSYCNDIKNCANCDVSGYSCSLCTKGTFLSNNNCYKCSDYFANCAECGVTGDVCTACNRMYAMQANQVCLKCNGIANCDTCDDAGQVCKTCVSGMYVKDNGCVNCQDAFPNCAECSLTSGCSSCKIPYALFNGNCVPGKQYLQQSGISSTFDDEYNQIIITFPNQLPISNNCSIILNPSLLGETPLCNFISVYKLRIILGKGWNIASGSNLYLNPNAVTLDGLYYAFPSSEILVNAMYPNSLNLPPTAVIEGPNNVASSCQKLTLSFSSSKSYGVALNTFNYFWFTDLPYGYGSILDERLPTLEITNFSYTSNFNVFLKVSNIFGTSKTAVYTVTVDTTQLKITVELDTGSNIKIKYTDTLTVTARIVDFCNIIGTASYSWSYNPNLNNNLRCYSNKCSMYGSSCYPGTACSLTVTAQISNSIAIYQSTATTQITSEFSAPYAIISQSSGDLHIGTYMSSYTISYTSNSNDPNGLGITLTWTSTIPENENLGSSSGVNINQMTIWNSQVTAFDLTLKADNGYKTSSQTIRVNVIKDVDPSVIVYVYPNNGRKVAKSSKLNVDSSYTYTSYYYSQPTVQWFVVPQIPAKLGTTFSIVFPGSTLDSGTYFFSAVMTVNNLVNSAYAKISINAGAYCPSNSIKFDPQSNVKTTTVLSFIIANCIDLDGQDLPLKYTFGYSTSPTGRVNYLTTASLSTKYSYKFTSGKIYGNFLVCDNLNDCASVVSSAVVVTKGRVRNLKDDSWVYDEYKQQSQLYELPAVIDYFLENYELPEDLVDTMWSNFTEYINYQMMDIDLFMIVESIAFQFINHQTLTFERIETYINFVNACLKGVEGMDADEDFRVRELANLILDVSLEMPYVMLANTLLDTLLGFNDMPVSVAYSQSTSHFSLLCVEDLASQLSNHSIAFGSLNVEVVHLSIPETSLLEVKAVSYSLGNYSDIFSLSFYSNKALKNTSITNETYEVLLEKGDILIEVPVSDSDLRCIMWNNSEWVEEGCSIVEISDGKAKLSITKRGVYTLSTVSAQYLRVPLYCIISLIMLSLILVPLLSYLDKVQSSTQSSAQTVKQCKDKTELDANCSSAGLSAIDAQAKSHHLVIGLFKPQEVFTRSKRVLLLTSNLSVLIYLSNLILAEVDTNPFISGVIAAASVFSLSLLINILLAKAGKIRNTIGVAIMITMSMTAIVGMFFLTAQSGWLISVLISSAIEFLVSQTLIMIVMRIIS